MSSLTGTKISNTYVGLLKTLDTTPLSATPKEISDGLGNASGVKLDNAGNLDVTNTVAFGSLKDTDEDITITKFVDEADGIENNDDDTSLPTSAAVKDYVDAYVTAQDLDFSGNTGTGDVDLDSEIFAITGSNGISTTAADATLIIDGSVLETGIATNATDIATNVTNISTNATGIATNVTNIAANETNIETNTTNIATNATNIATNTATGVTNATNIATNVTDIATNATNIALKVSKAGDTMTGNLAIEKTTTAGDSGTLTLGDPTTTPDQGDTVGGSIKFVNGFRTDETSITHQIEYEDAQEFQSNISLKLDGQQFVSLNREVGSGYTNETIFIQKDTKFTGSQNRVLSANGYGFGSTYGDNFTIKDYEEGTYNITFSLRQDNSGTTGGTNIGSSGFTSFTNNSRYVKVGRKVTLYLNLEYTDPISTNWNSSYYVALDNLPFEPTVDGSSGSAFGAGGTYNFESNYQTNQQAHNILVRNLGYGNYTPYITLGGGFIANYPNYRRMPLKGSEFPQYNLYGNTTTKVKLLGVVEYYTSA